MPLSFLSDGMIVILVGLELILEGMYDFVDDWRHEIKVEKVLEAEAGTIYPICLAGERTCPVEDCGGPWVYERCWRF